MDDKISLQCSFFMSDRENKNIFSNYRLRNMYFILVNSCDFSADSSSVIEKQLETIFRNSFTGKKGEQSVTKLNAASFDSPKIKFTKKNNCCICKFYILQLNFRPFCKCRRLRVTFVRRNFNSSFFELTFQT